MSRTHLITTKGVIVEFHKYHSGGCDECYFFKRKGTRSPCGTRELVADITDDESEKCMSGMGIWKEVDSE